MARAGGEIEAIALIRVHAKATDVPTAGAPELGGDRPLSPNAEAERPSAADAAFHEFVTAWDAVPASADQPPRLEIAHEAASDTNDRAGERWTPSRRPSR
jgi:hypothetical protein